MGNGTKFGTLWKMELTSISIFSYFPLFSVPSFLCNYRSVINVKSTTTKSVAAFSLSLFPSPAKHRISNLAEQKIFYIDFQFFSLFVTSKVNISSTRSLIFSNFQGERSEEEKSVHVDCENIWRKAISVSVYTQKK